jgi:deazaflavin-dependent oxidoreductase (nitroreductase family)
MGLLTPVAVRVGSISWMPKLLPQIVMADKLLQRVTLHRYTILDIAGLPNLVLTVTGRKSGLPRSTPLLCAPDGSRILVAGSNFGGDKEPLWVKNIEANPSVTVRVGAVDTQRTARMLEGAERAAAWQVLLDVWPNFAKYEQRTQRTIKVFELA